MKKFGSYKEFAREIEKFPKIGMWENEDRIITIPERVYVGMVKEVSEFMKKSDASAGMEDKSRTWYWDLTYQMGVAEDFDGYDTPKEADEFTDKNGLNEWLVVLAQVDLFNK